MLRLPLLLPLPPAASRAIAVPAATAAAAGTDGSVSGVAAIAAAAPAGGAVGAGCCGCEHILTSSGNAASDGPALQAAGARAGPAPPCELSPALATDWCGSAGHPVVASEAASGRPPLGCAFDGTPNRRRGTTEMDYDDA